MWCPRLFEYYKENYDPACPNYVLLEGEDAQPAKELQALIEGFNGQKPDLCGKMGVCVAINAGPASWESPSGARTEPTR